MAEIVGTIMMASTIAAGNMPPLPQRRGKKRNGLEVVVKPIASRPDHGNDDEDPPQPVNHAGDGRQQLHEVLQQESQGRPASLFQNGRNCRPNSLSNLEDSRQRGIVRSRKWRRKGPRSIPAPGPERNYRKCPKSAAECRTHSRSGPRSCPWMKAQPVLLHGRPRRHGDFIDDEHAPARP